jgi:MoaA/NifB/PqqE/SkfB family radical SAM enzyme
MLSLPLRIARARLAREGLCAAPLPLGLTVSVTDRCNARCLTCGLHQRGGRQPGAPLSLADYDRIFCSVGRRLHWVTVTGGEPSLREDVSDVLVALVARTAPRVITLATNGLLVDRVVDMVRAVLAVHRHALIVNLSLDALGADHDRIRGVEGAWGRATATFRRLRRERDRYPNLVLGIHAVISRHNVEMFPEICDGLLALAPDSLVAEVAQSRAELSIDGLNLAPEPQAYRRAITHLLQRTGGYTAGPRRPARRTARLIQAFRTHYYHAVARYLEQPQELWPCLAGTASAHLGAGGTLWACGVRCDELGDLRQAESDFAEVWHGDAARRVRQRIRDQRCHCTLANAAYINMLGSPTALARVAATRAKMQLPGAR